MPITPLAPHNFVLIQAIPWVHLIFNSTYASVDMDSLIDDLNKYQINNAKPLKLTLDLVIWTIYLAAFQINYGSNNYNRHIDAYLLERITQNT